MGDFQTKEWLMEKQALPLEAKLEFTLRRAKDFIEFCEARGYEPAISFSAGKDSTVLKDILRREWPWLKLVFVNTRLEYKEIIHFARAQENIDVVSPELSFKEIVERYGYPAVSKKVARAIEDLQSPLGKREKIKMLRLTGITSTGKTAPSQKMANKWQYLINGPKLSDKCCNYMKINPLRKYQKKNKTMHFIGTMASDSQKREKSFLEHGCNSYFAADPKSAPMSIWTEQDVLTYIKTTGLPICSRYGDIVETETGLCTTGCARTGCVGCGFGACIEQERTGTNRFLKMHDTDPELWMYYIMKMGGLEVFNYIGLPVVPGQTFEGWKPRVY